MHNLWCYSAIFLIFMMDSAQFLPSYYCFKLYHEKINEKVDLWLTSHLLWVTSFAYIKIALRLIPLITF